MPLMNRRVSTERYLWSCAALTALSILLLAAWGRAAQHYIEKFLGPESMAAITIFFVLAGLWLFWIYVIKNPVRRIRRLILFLLIAAFYAWRLLTLHVQVERFHLIEYGLLAVLVCAAMQRHDYDWLALGWGFAAAWFMGMADELFQWWLPARVGEWRDVVINIQSGALGLAAFVLLETNRFKWRRVPRRQLVYLCLAFSTLVFLSGAFITRIHVFGHRNVDPDIGTFNSFFTADELLENTLDDYLAQVEAAGGHQSDTFRTDHYLYFFEREAREHFDKTHLLIEQNKLPEAASEYRLTQKYFRPWMEGNTKFYSREIRETLESVSPVAPDTFTSRVFDWLMVSVTRTHVILLSLAGGFLFLILSAAIYRRWL